MIGNGGGCVPERLPQRRTATLPSLLPATAREWISLALAVAALAMLGFRFWRLGDAPFILDEPQFLSAAREQLQTGHWAQASPIYGTQGIRYGPSVLWFYGVVQWLFGPRPETSIAAMCVTLCLAHAALAAGLARVFGGGRLLFAVILAFVASSPFQFIWSRLAWDQLVNVCAGCVVFLLCTRGRLRLPTLLPLGFLLGYAISSHPMVLPFVACTGAIIAIEMWRTPKRLALACIALGFGMLLVNIPYLRFLAHEPFHRGPRGTFSASMLGEQLLQPLRVATFVRIEYFFDDDWIELKRWLGGWLSLYPASAAVLTLLALSSAAGLALGLRSRAPERRRIALLAGLCWAGYALVYATRNLEPHPHYQFPVYWVTAAGVASLVAWISERRPLYGNLASSAVLVFAFLQFAFIIGVAQFLHERNGTRGIHYSTPVAQQEELVRAVCRQPEPTVVLQNMTSLFPHSLKYISSVVHDCADKALQICPPECTQPSPSVRMLNLRYAKTQGGAIAF